MKKNEGRNGFTRPERLIPSACADNQRGWPTARNGRHVNSNGHLVHARTSCRYAATCIVETDIGNTGVSVSAVCNYNREDGRSDRTFKRRPPYRPRVDHIIRSIARVTYPIPKRTAVSRKSRCINVHGVACTRTCT